MRFPALAVAVSSLTTMIIIAIGALLLTPLKPILELPQVVTATPIRPASFIWMSDALHLQQKLAQVARHCFPRATWKALIIPFIIAAALYPFILARDKSQLCVVPIQRDHPRQRARLRARLLRDHALGD